MRYYNNSRLLFLLLSGLLILANLTALSHAQADKTVLAKELVLILDASGSMWGQIEGENKISIAKGVLKNLVNELPDNTEVGLIAYGHREKGDCGDIETIVKPAPLDKDAINKQIDSLNPKGKTPITDSVLMAFDLVKASEDATTVILVSDGIETCGGDPCQAVKEAKEAGVNFIMHVVGFDVGDVDVSELECAAQAGGGLYLSAQNASELTKALQTAVEIPAELPTGKLSVKVTAEGKLQDSFLILTNTDTGELLSKQRTYRNSDTNPRIISLADGVYDLEVKPLGLEGVDGVKVSAIEIKQGEVVEKEIEFGFGELSVKALRNDKLTGTTVAVYDAQTDERVVQIRTYTDEKSNPQVLKLEPGLYYVEVTSLEIDTNPSKKLEAIQITSGEKVEHVVEYTSGTIKVGALQGEKFLDSVVKIIDTQSSEKVAQGRTYKNSDSNPKAFELPPGTYSVIVEVLGIEGNPSMSFDDVVLGATEVVEKTAQFTSGTLKVGVFEGEKLLDSMVYILKPDSDEKVAQSRTYKDSNTNPKSFELPPGIYDVRVKSLNIEGNPEVEFKGVGVKAGESIEKEAQFTTATLKIGAKNEDRLAEAKIIITNSKTGERVANNRTYMRANDNPRVFELTPGLYDIEVTALDMSSKSSHELKEVELKAGDEVEKILQFPRGQIKVSSTMSGENIQSRVMIKDARTGEQLATRNTELSSKHNPVEFILPPGSYEIVVQAYKIEANPEKVIKLDLKNNDTLDIKAEFSE